MLPTACAKGCMHAHAHPDTVGGFDYQWYTVRKNVEVLKDKRALGGLNGGLTTVGRQGRGRRVRNQRVLCIPCGRMRRWSHRTLDTRSHTPNVACCLCLAALGLP